jgi:hypothetical protein
MKIKNILTGISAAFAVASCEIVDPMASEQYRKDIYIVGAYNRVSTFDLPYGESQNAFVSVAVSGTLSIEADVEVTLAGNNSIIDWYNGKYMLDAPVKYKQLSEASLTVPSWKTTIRAGDVYAHLPFTVNSTGLHCDSLYAIGVAIASVSGYQKSAADTALILTFRLTNEFSGSYQMEATKVRVEPEVLDNGDTASWVETGLPLPVSIRRTLTAMSADTVRLFHEKTKETLAEYSNSYDPGADYFAAISSSCVKFGRVPGSDKFTVQPYDAFPVLDGEATFANGGFTFRYDYTEGAARYRIQGTLSK